MLSSGAANVKNFNTSSTNRIAVALSRRGIKDTLDNLALARVVAFNLLSWYRTDDAQWFKCELIEDDFDGLPEARIFETAARPISQGERVVRCLAEQL